MHNLHVPNVNVALAEALHHIIISGDCETSRNGTVMVAPQPVVTTYYKPLERVLFSPVRDANPFFHFMEALWMLAGRNDLKFPLMFNKRFAEYSDDGHVVHGAYGHRWRHYFGYDQLDEIVSELTKNPNSRRAVLSMWNAMYVGEDEATLEIPSDPAVARAGGKDVPCNTHAYFDLRGGVLNMTVCCRSNDVLWGAYGANAVHFAFLLEYMAHRLGVKVGVYRQFSNNLHVYTDIYPRDKLTDLANDAEANDLYQYGYGGEPVKPMPLINGPIEGWQADLHRFMRRDGIPNPHGWNDVFFSGVAVPMYLAWEMHKSKAYETALHVISGVKADDWRIACTEWLERRYTKYKTTEEYKQGTQL